MKRYEVRVTNGGIWWSRVRCYSTYEQAYKRASELGVPAQIRSLEMVSDDRGQNIRWRESQVEWENQQAIDQRNQITHGDNS